MKITTVSVHLLTLELRTPFTTSFGTYKTLSRPFVVIETDEGLRGVGEIPTMTEPSYKAEADTASVLTSLKEFILPSLSGAGRRSGGAAADDALPDSPVPPLLDAVQRRYEWIKGAVFAKSGIEAAIWDILAQRARQPLWRMWGGEPRSFPVGVSIGGKTIEQVLALAENATGLGYRRLKVKIWPGFDVRVVQGLRERYPDILLQVDANSAYDLTNWRDLQALDQFDLLLIEQPLFDDDIVQHSEISRELRTPVCLDESIHSLRDTEAAISLWQRNDALDRLIVNIKPPRVSGFRESIAIANRCRDVGVRTWIGGMLDSAWGKAFNLNLNGLSAIDLPGDHFSPSGAYFEEDIAGPALVATDGAYTLTDGVSTGLTFDWQAFERLGERLFQERIEP